MLKFIEIFTNLFLILIILFRVPLDSVGLTSFNMTTNILGSPNSVRYFLNILTFIGILSYFGLAFQLNLLNYK